MYSTIVLRNKDQYGNSTVYVQYSYSAKEIKRVPTGVKVNSKFFDKVGQKIRKGGTSNTDADNKTLSAVRSNVDSVVRRYIEEKGVPPTVKQLEQEYGKLNDTKSAKRFSDYIEEFIDLKRGTVDPNTIKGYRNLKDNIVQYEAIFKVKLDFLDVNTVSFFTQYTNFLINEKKYLNSTIQKRLGVFKTILNHFYLTGENKSLNFKLFKFQNTTAKNQEVISLDTNELEALKRLDLSNNKRLERVRDYFLVECWTGLRYTDLMGMTKQNFKNEKINRWIEKTEEFLTIPLFPEAKQVLEKYDFELKKISNHKYNVYLKEVCALVPELQEELTKVHFSGVKKIKETRKKCDWVSSHVGRKTFVSLLLELDVKSAQIMKWTGHTSLKSFEKYINKNQGEQTEVERLKINYKEKVKALS